MISESLSDRYWTARERITDNR